MLFERKNANEPSVVRADGISPRLAQLLYTRGARDEAAMEAFLHPSAAQFLDPLLLKDMDRAVERIRRAKGEKICVYGDYDADGVCATAILTDCLRRMGLNAAYALPSRHEGGYGLNVKTVERLAQEGVGLIVTVDNGVKAYGEIARAYELGMEAIVTDHHRCDGRIPECEAVVCHTREDDGYPNKFLCGAGLAWKLAEALVGAAEAKRYIPLAGLATLADVVPLAGENRALAAVALGMINAGECCEGLKALNEKANKRAGRLTERHMVFGFAPRLNAAGRMKEADICVELLLSEEKARTREIAEELNSLNALRQSEEGGVCEAACALIEADDLTQKRSIALKGEGWNPGVIGVAASRIAERYYRPTILFSEKDGVLTGSARSIPNVDIYSALNANSRLFTRFGGHVFAAGVTMPAANFDEFAAGFDAALRASFSAELFLPRTTYETELEFSELTMRMAEELELLAPFGEGNPEPVFRTDNVLLRGVRRIGSTGNDIKATAIKDERYVEAVAFSQGALFDELMDMERCDVIYAPSVNEWNGMRSVQMRIEGLRRAEFEDEQGFILARRDKFFDAFSRNILYNSWVSAKDGGAPELDSLLTEDIAGSLVLCTTPDGAVDFAQKLRQSGLFKRIDVSFCAPRRSPCAYHAAVFAPMLDGMDISRYRRILLWDSGDEGLAQRIRAMAPRAEVWRGGGGSECFSSLAMGREGMARYYKCLAASERRFFNRGELGDYLASAVSRPKYEAHLAVSVMLELGFISSEGELRLIKGAPQRDLLESPTYFALDKLKK